MGRIMALDYGKKRTGIAITDPLKMIATALETVETKKLRHFLTNYLLNENVEILVIGKPYTRSFEVNEIETDIQHFIQWFAERFPNILVKRIDERFTSKMASKTILDSGVNKKTRAQKEIIDRVSATIILQTYLEMNF